MDRSAWQTRHSWSCERVRHDLASKQQHGKLEGGKYGGIHCGNGGKDSWWDGTAILNGGGAVVNEVLATEVISEQR